MWHVFCICNVTLWRKFEKVAENPWKSHHCHLNFNHNSLKLWFEQLRCDALVALKKAPNNQSNRPNPVAISAPTSLFKAGRLSKQQDTWKWPHRRPYRNNSSDLLKTSHVPFIFSCSFHLLFSICSPSLLSLKRHPLKTSIDLTKSKKKKKLKTSHQATCSNAQVSSRFNCSKLLAPGMWLQEPSTRSSWKRCGGPYLGAAARLAAVAEGLQFVMLHPLSLKVQKNPGHRKSMEILAWFVVTLIISELANYGFFPLKWGYVRIAPHTFP